MRIKVINIINHAPPYEGHRGRPRPKVNWDLPNGDWIGIWGYDWHNLIGNHVLEVAPDINYEVWQPDYKADKIYTHVFENGLVHKLFPASDLKYLHGLHVRKDIYSDMLMEELERECQINKELVLHVNAGHCSMVFPIVNKFYKRVPIVGQFYTNSIDILKIKKTWNPLKKLNSLLKYFELVKFYKKIKYIIPSVSEGSDLFEKKFGIKVFYRDFANFGRNFSEWSRKKTISEAKMELGIDQDKFVMFSSSRLIPVKQIDKLIIALSRVKYDNYICYISGRGSEAYEEYLNGLVSKYNLSGKIKFIGYVDFDELYTYYQASDLVVSTSFQDAGPAPVSNAAAMGVPTLLTATGIGYEFYKLYNVGNIVPIDGYDIWTKEIEAIIHGKKVPVPDRKDVESFGSWEIVSKYYYDIYKSVLNQ